MESMNSNGTEEGTARSVVDQVREGAKSQLSTQKDRATDRLGQLAQAVRQSTTSFREHQHDTLAHYVEGAADQIERFSARLRERDLGELMQDAQQFARRRPAVFIGTAYILGAFAARFLKSSSDSSRQTNGRDQAFGRYATGMNEASSSGYDGDTPGAPRYAGGGL